MRKLVIIATIFSTFSTFAQTDIEAGKTTFKSRCAACHNIEKVLVGPALKDVEKRYSEKWIIDFVHSSQTMIKNGDKDAVAIFNQMNQTVMPDHTDLKDADIQNILAYVKDESGKLEAKASETPFARPAEVKGADRPLDFYNDIWTFAGFFTLLVLIIVGLTASVHIQTMINEKGQS